MLFTQLQYTKIPADFGNGDLQPIIIMAGESTLGRVRLVFVMDQYDNIISCEVVGWKKGRLQLRLLRSKYSGLLPYCNEFAFEWISDFLDNMLHKTLENYGTDKEVVVRLMKDVITRVVPDQNRELQ